MTLHRLVRLAFPVLFSVPASICLAAGPASAASGAPASASAAAKAPAAITAPPASAVVDPEAAELLRAWLAGSPASIPHSAFRIPHSNQDPLADWRAYLKALAIPAASARESALRAAYSKTHSPLLRMVILRTITENPEYQGRQALFIRHYGFYANWFNRLTYSTVQLVQGNIQVLGQLVVDGFNDLFAPGTADPSQRRAYDLLRRSWAEGTITPREREQLAKLERGVQRALAQADLDQAQYCMETGDPEAAAFYASQAHLLRPDWSKAEKLQRKAEAEAARLRRDQVASSQVGYPDRTPQVEMSSPELLRAVLAGTPQPAGLPPSERMVAAVLRDLPASHTATATMMRPWVAHLNADPKRDAYAHRWLETVIQDPQVNVDARLNQARAQYRSSLWKYIFLGPERPRERVYKTASWAAQAWDAMQNVGIFYVFELVGRAGQAVWSPPVPAEEILDAQAAWLRLAPDPRNKEARKIGKDLYDAYMKQSRFDDARRVLETTGQLTPSRTKKIDKAYAVWLLEQAQQMEAGPEREAVVARIATLAPGSTTADKAKKIAEDEKRHAETKGLTLDWEAMARWTGRKPPCGLPGEPAWFDGSPAGGEALKAGLTLERKGSEPTVTVRYPVMQGGSERVYQIQVPFDKLPAPVRRWFELSTSQRTEAAATIKQLNHLPIPFAVEGGAGLSGFDLYPKLLPIETRPGETELYK